MKWIFHVHVFLSFYIIIQFCTIQYSLNSSITKEKLERQWFEDFCAPLIAFLQRFCLFEKLLECATVSGRVREDEGLQSRTVRETKRCIRSLGQFSGRARLHRGTQFDHCRSGSGYHSIHSRGDFYRQKLKNFGNNNRDLTLLSIAGTGFRDR